MSKLKQDKTLTFTFLYYKTYASRLSMHLDPCGQASLSDTRHAPCDVTARVR